MALTVGVNSYATVAEADDYFADLFNASDWEGITNKEGALVSATKILDASCLWYGSKVDDDQDLAFPRYPDADPVPDDIKNAQCDIALNIGLTGSTSTDGGDPLTKLVAGSVEMEFDASSTSNPLINDVTVSILSQYGLCSGNSGSKLVPLMRG